MTIRYPTFALGAALVGLASSNGCAKHEPKGRLQAAPTPPTQVTYTSSEFPEHVKVSAVLDAAPLRPGDSFRVGVVFAIEDGWHIYGNPVGPGVGRATTVKVSAQGAAFDPARYAPAEKATQSFGEAGTTWIWENRGRVVHYVSGRVSPDASPGRSTWLVEARAQACTKTQCLPAKITIQLPVEIAPRDAPQTKETSDDFSGFDKTRVPPAA